MKRSSTRLSAIVALALAIASAWLAAQAQTPPAPPSTEAPAPTTATAPATLPAAGRDPTVASDQLRAYIEKMSHKDHAAPAAPAAPLLEITLQALVVGSHGEGTAILTIKGHGSFTVTAGSVLLLSADASGPQVKVTAVSATGVEVLLPQAKTPITIQ